MKRTSVKEIAKRYAELDFALICEEKYSNLKQLDWVVFAILKNQESLSLHSYEKGNRSYVDEDMNVFIRISQEKLAKLVKTSLPTLRASLKRLQEAELIEVIVTGVNKCNKIYCGEPVRTITFEEYFKKIGKDIEADTEEVKPSIKVTNIEDIKKAPTYSEVEANEELENKKDSYNVNSNKNSIPQNNNSNNKSNKEFKPNYSLNPKIHKNLSTKFLNYGNDEDLEKMLLESQKNKFNEN